MAENSTKIKQRILEIADFIGSNKEVFLSSIGQTYGNYKGKSKNSIPSADVLAEISTKYPDINIHWVLTGHGSITNEIMPADVVDKTTSVFKLRTDYNVADQRIPLYNLEASAGLVELFQNHNDAQPIDTIHIPNLPKCDGAVYVTGDSMYPLLKSGDIIAYKEVSLSIDSIFFGEMYLISIDLDGEEFISVKFIQRSDKGEAYVKLVSQNTHHQAKDIPLKKVRALALVKASVRINSMA